MNERLLILDDPLWLSFGYAPVTRAFGYTLNATNLMSLVFPSAILR